MDETDGDLSLFFSLLLAAPRTIFGRADAGTLELLQAQQQPRPSLRAKGKITEIRSHNLRLTVDETAAKLGQGLAFLADVSAADADRQKGGH
jgi:hypothetical protein